ncbi:hypothetical protein [Clostridium sp. MD294]|uniref:hypothetical protein n=2 Tax=Clostridium sp. MD294 TaxID=97138 RepID=UPI0002CC4803|nr:hypothetical protein [Clostridium sp. MD294]USF29779.1 hypothetical protein C820_001187 [Clostridium sp. MD294]
MMKKYVLSDTFCLYTAIICQCYIMWYEKFLYYKYYFVDLFMIIYQFIAFPLFWFCVVKPLGSMFQKKVCIKRSEMLKKLNMILLLVYILFYIAVTSNFIHYSSLLKFFVHILFGTVGFINGLYYRCSNKK